MKNINTQARIIFYSIYIGLGAIIAFAVFEFIAPTAAITFVASMFLTGDTLRKNSIRRITRKLERNRLIAEYSAR